VEEIVGSSDDLAPCLGDGEVSGACPELGVDVSGVSADKVLVLLVYLSF
jgi:hypothetical protein